jgi:hypothetical protein
MALSDTTRRVLAAAIQHPLRLATPPTHLPAAACGNVLRIPENGTGLTALQLNSFPFLVPGPR